MKRAIVACIVLAVRAHACQLVEGDRIRAADLAAAAPAFAKLDPAIEIGLSPLPGIKRIFSPADLIRLARANGIDLAAPPSEVCFERRGGSARTATKPIAIPPVAVHRGDRVTVTVVSGDVLLKFESEAESAGRLGETVIVRNPENGNRFTARVEEEGKVSVKK